MEQKLYQNGFYLFLGIIITLLSVNFCSIKTTESVKHDTIFVHDTLTIEKHITLNKSNLIEECKKQGVHHPHIVAAQAVLESGNFKSQLTRTHNNFLGIKKGKKYAKYDSWAECVSDYKKRVQSKYKGGDYYQFLQNIGYAEDPEYLEKLRKYA